MNLHTAILAAAPQAPIQMPTQGTWLGNAGGATLAVVLLWGSWFLAKNQMLLWGPWIKSKTEGKIKFDWLSLLSFAFGFWGITSLLGASGFAGLITSWPQGILKWFGETGIGTAIGAGGICFIITLYALKQALKKKDDSVRDIFWGAGLAVVYPLGGGPFLWVSATMSNVLVQLLGGIPMATS